jgi:hypothetical protein
MQNRAYFSTCLLTVVMAAAFGAASAGERELFNGRDFAGWEAVTTPGAPIESILRVLPDGVIAAAGQPSGFVATTASYTDYRLHAEWRWSGKPGNGGVLLHISEGKFDRVWPISLQVQTKHGNVGDVLPMSSASFAEPLTSSAPSIRAHTAADSEKPVGEWNSCDIVSRAGTVEVTINGVLQNRITQAAPQAGRIGFQLEGTPFELRNVRVAPLD